MTRLAPLLPLVLAALLLSAPAAASSSLTKGQAYKKARACLLRHGSGFVGRRADGGGFATFTRGRGSTFWRYRTFLGQVSSVTVWFAGRPGPSAAQRKQAERCLTAGI